MTKKIKKPDFTWKTIFRKANSLIPFEDNPRKMDEKQVADLQESIEKFNLVEIPAINTDGTIIAGHQRIKVLQLLGRGEEDIEVRIPSRKLTEKELREYNLRSNKNVGSWDYDILAHFDAELLQAVGFQEYELGILNDSVITDQINLGSESAENPKEKYHWLTVEFENRAIMEKVQKYFGISGREMPATKLLTLFKKAGIKL